MKRSVTKSSVLYLIYIEVLCASCVYGLIGGACMSFSILRLERVKNYNDVTGIQKHVERQTKNYTNVDIDKTKTAMNYDLLFQRMMFDVNYNELIKERLEEGYRGKRQVRSDAIKLVDGLITSDDVFFEDMDDQQVRTFFEDALEFIKAEYGEENIVYAKVHLDEKTPHMHFGFVPLTTDGRLSAKEVLGNKKKMSLLQDKFNDYVNEKGYKLERGERAIETERKHVDVSNFKQQTEYHKSELEQVQRDFDATLEKWDKARQLNLQHEKDEVAPIIARNTGESMPHVEIKEKRFGRTEIDKEQVEELQEWGNNAVSLIRKQQQSMNERDKTIENLQEIIKSQDKQIEQRAKSKYKRDYERIQIETANLKEENNHLQAKNYDLYEENNELRSFKDKAIVFMKETGVYQQFQKISEKIKRKISNFERDI